MHVKKQSGYLVPRFCILDLRIYFYYYLYMPACVCMNEGMCVCRCPWRPERLGVGVIGHTGAGNQAWVLRKSNYCF